MISQCHPSSSSKMLPGALDSLEGESWQESGGERKVLCHGGAAQPGTETLPNIRVKAPGMSSAEPSHLHCKAIQGICWMGCCCKCCAPWGKKKKKSNLLGSFSIWAMAQRQGKGLVGGMQLLGQILPHKAAKHRSFKRRRTYISNH